MAYKSYNGGGGSGNSEKDDDNTLLWKYVTELGEPIRGERDGA